MPDWSCPQCTLINVDSDDSCAVCGCDRPEQKYNNNNNNNNNTSDDYEDNSNEIEVDTSGFSENLNSYLVASSNPLSSLEIKKITYNYVDKDIIDVIKCSICNQPFAEPTQLFPCKHIFCKYCLSNYFVNSKLLRTECPYRGCNNLVNIHDYKIKKVANLNILRKLNSLEVYCSNAEAGCSWKGCRSELDEHLSLECEFTFRNCKYESVGCDFKGEDSIVSAHENKCSFKMFESVFSRLLSSYYQQNELIKEHQAKIKLYEAKLQQYEATIRANKQDIYNLIDIVQTGSFVSKESIKKSFKKNIVPKIISKGSFASISELTSKIAYSSCILHEGLIYIIGGKNSSSERIKDVFAYDPNTNVYTKKSSLPTERSHHCTAAYNGKVYVFGGISVGSKRTGVILCYDIKRDSWTTCKTFLSKPRSEVRCCQVDKKVYVVGGYEGTCMNTIEIFDLSKDCLKEDMIEMPSTRSGCGCVSFNDKIYIFGGYDANSGYLSSCDIYDTLSKTWSVGPSMSFSRYGATGITDGKHIYVIGGYNNTTYLKTFERLSPNSDSWVLMKNQMNSGRQWLCGEYAGGNIFVFGGRNNSNPKYFLEECETITL